MDLNEYQKLAARTLTDDCSNLTLGALGLTGEAGEVADLVKKHLFHGHELDDDKLDKELGDVLWYLAALCSMRGRNLDDVAQKNVDKLKERYPDGFCSEASLGREEGRVMSWGAPGPVARWVCGEHKTCWNCQFIQVAGMPNRRCGLLLEGKYVYGGPFDELDPLYDFGHEPGRTVADDCASYQDSDVLDQLPVREITRYL